MRRAVAWGVVCCAGLAAILCSSVVVAQSANTAMVLDRGWQFRQSSGGGGTSDNGWLPASVPGDVHLDLLANKRIPDPFFRDNEAKLQWIDEASWEYQLNFDVPAAVAGRANVDLVFDGLDAAAEVYVNDAKVLDADNMFRVWRVPVKGKLQAGKNVLRVVFPSPIKAAEKVAATDPWQPKTRTAAKTYIRKAAYEYGWDWGPTFVTSGIWRPLRIEAWDKVRIADFAIRQRDVSKEVAHLDAEVEVEAASAGEARVTATYTFGGLAVEAERLANLHVGRNVIDLPIEIREPNCGIPRDTAISLCTNSQHTFLEARLNQMSAID